MLLMICSSTFDVETCVVVMEDGTCEQFSVQQPCWSVPGLIIGLASFDAVF